MLSQLKTVVFDFLADGANDSMSAEEKDILQWNIFFLGFSENLTRYVAESFIDLISPQLSKADQ